jgi:hypothetical protein
MKKEDTKTNFNQEF